MKLNLRKCFSFRLATLLLVFVPGITLATPVIDKDVREFLSSPKTLPSQVLPVLLTYKRQAQLPQRPFHPRFHAEIERAMIRNTQAQQRQVFKAGLVPKKTLWIVNGTTTYVTQDQLQQLMQSTVVSSITYSLRKVRLVRPARGASSSNADAFTYGLQKLNVPEMRLKFPALDGAGIRVGILDTGIDANHPDLAGKVENFKDFTPSQNPKPTDGHGHGTHVAGTIAGGATSGTSIGVAPKASLIIGKVFDDQGSATDEALLLAMQWMADPDGNPNTNDFPQVVSNSWGDDANYDDKDPAEDPFCKIIDNWVRLGMVPVFAAGNSGPGSGTVGTPGGCPQALAVGATDSNDRAPSFSSRGPAKWKTGSLVKPDIAAPGVSVRSSKPGGGYQSMSGTSMATPHISGVMAILLQVNPNLTVDAAIKTLLSGATDLGATGKDMVYGWGRADVLKSVGLLKPNWKK
jgi:subtilisin family serine protease